MIKSKHLHEFSCSCRTSLFVLCWNMKTNCDIIKPRTFWLRQATPFIYPEKFIAVHACSFFSIWYNYTHTSGSILVQTLLLSSCTVASWFSVPCSRVVVGGESRYALVTWVKNILLVVVSGACLCLTLNLQVFMGLILHNAFWRGV